MAIVNTSDITYTIKFNLQAIIRIRIELTLRTYSLSLSDILAMSSMTTKNCLVINLQIVKKSFCNLTQLCDFYHIRIFARGSLDQNPSSIVCCRSSINVLCDLAVKQRRMRSGMSNSSDNHSIQKFNRFTNCKLENLNFSCRNKIFTITAVILTLI